MEKIPGGCLSSGSSLLNLICTDDVRWAFKPGHMYYWVGDSSSGKTWTALTILAEATLKRHYEDYLLIHDDVEYGAGMSISHYFGQKLAERIQTPTTVGSSKTVQDFYRNIRKLQKDGKKFIYILDSQDALDSEEAEEKFEEQAAAAKKGKKVAGSYGDGKPKYHSQNIRRVVGALPETGSILIILNQTRDNLKSPYGGSTASGGKALKFYSWIKLQSKVREKIKRTKNGKERTIGIHSGIFLDKNRETGKHGADREVKVPIYFSHGIDDTGAMVDFLLEYGVFTKSKSSIVAGPLEMEGLRENLIEKIEEDPAHTKKLKLLCHKAWNDVETSVQVRRKKKYG